MKGSDAKVTMVSDKDSSQKSKAKSLTPPKNKKSKSSDKKSSRKKNAVKNGKKGETAQTKDSQVTETEIAEATKRTSLDETPQAVIDGNGQNSSELMQQLPADSEFSINGEWTIYSVRNNVISGEERPYINFDLAAKRVYGSNGCNYLNGDLVAEGKHLLKVENIITTMKMCDNAPFEHVINLAVSDIRSYEVRNEGSETYLDLRSTSGTIILVLRRHNMDFLNGAWSITAIGGKAVSGENRPTITIDIPDLKIHGTTGCNIFNGELFIDPDKRRSMQFAHLTTTQTDCPDVTWETELLLALEEVEHARLTDRDTVEMYGKDGNLLLTLKKLNLPKE